MLLLLLPQLLLLSLASMVWMWRGEATTPAWPADHTEMLKSRFFFVKMNFEVSDADLGCLGMFIPDPDFVYSGSKDSNKIEG
jgi:hypothetical protein